MKLLISPWKNEFVKLLASARNYLLISSPFIDESGVKTLLSSLQRPEKIEIRVITNLSVGNIKNKGIDVNALLLLYKYFRKVEISSLGKLHAKVYLLDGKKAIITSANLTHKGLSENFEYGIVVEEKEMVNEIKEDMEKYFQLGNVFSFESLKNILEYSETLLKIQRNIEERIGNSRKLKEVEEKLKFEILKNRTKSDKSVNSIFAETILYLLKKKGPLSTKELHPLIQRMHPDICDDSIDRIINGQRFGKKWKHMVRSAQQFLKRKGLIELRNGKWYLLK